MIGKFLLGGISYTAKGLKHMKKHKKKMYKLRQAHVEAGRARLQAKYPNFKFKSKNKTGYGSFVDKTKWI